MKLEIKLSKFSFNELIQVKSDEPYNGGILSGWLKTLFGRRSFWIIKDVKSSYLILDLALECFAT